MTLPVVRSSAAYRLLGLLIHTQNDRPLGRVEIQADDVTNLGYEQRVLGQLPGLLAMRLQAERPPDP
jgi:hypothetical protein